MTYTTCSCGGQLSAHAGEFCSACDLAAIDEAEAIAVRAYDNLPPVASRDGCTGCGALVPGSVRLCASCARTDPWRRI